MKNLISFYLPINFILFSLLTLNIYSCGSDGVRAPSNADVNFVYTTKLDIAYTFSVGSNNYRPLGNDPSQGNEIELTNAFLGITFSDRTMTHRNSPDSSFENSFDLENPDGFLAFLNEYCRINSIVYYEYEKIHLFGIRNAYDNWTNIIGIAENLYSLIDPISNQKTPALAFVFSGFIDSLFLYRNSQQSTFGFYPDGYRKKMIKRTAVHELSHARGMLDNPFNYPYNDPHEIHRDLLDTFQLNGCLMRQTLSLTNKIDHYYPPVFCKYHKDIFQDSLRDKIKKYIDFPNP